MKNSSARLQTPRILYIATIILIFLFPVQSHATGSGGNTISIFVSCVEDLGDGHYRAYFGYENTYEITITVPSLASILWYNHGRSTRKVLNTFEPGVHDKVFSQEFDEDDWVKWIVRVGFLNYKWALATSASDICEGELPIIPYYAPPEGGKVMNSKIGAALTSLNTRFQADPNNFEGQTDFIFQINGTQVYIELFAESGQFTEMMSEVASLGFNAVIEDPNLGKATGWTEIGGLLDYNEVQPLNSAHPVYPGIGNFVVPATGLVNSQGDKAMRSDFARLGFDVDGSGVKIGVLSNSYNTQGRASEDVGNGDLPGAANPNGYLTEVDVIQDVTPAYGSLSDEGRAMLQIIHDIAPGAELAFRTGYLGELDMATGITELAAAGCDVIVDDLTYITEPFFRDGIISQSIDQVVSDGVAFFSSSGNFGSASYAATFTSAPAPPSLVGDVHDFGGGDILQGIELPEGTYTIVLQWDDGSDPQMATTSTDMDLYLTNDAATTFLGFNGGNVGGPPIEVIPFSVMGDTVQSNILISRASGPDVPVSFKYIVFRGGSLFRMLEHIQGTSTIVGHPNAEGAIAVGAVRYDKNPVYSPDTYPEPVIMSFSSTGGTPVDGVVRIKPDFAAPNGINTTVDLGSGDWDGDADTYPNFFGTSAASPHAAAVAALIMEANMKFDPDHPLDPEGIRTLMRSTAMDMNTPGFDYISGAGFIRADLALLSFANPLPYLENLIPDPEGGEPGATLDPLSFTISGDFFTDETQVLFRGDPLTSGVTLEDDQNIQVDHPGFLGNPTVQAYNPPKSPSGLDGGLSDTTYFSDPIRQRVYIMALNASKKYGEQLPDFASEVMVVSYDGDSTTLDNAVLSGLVTEEEADRFRSVFYQVPATVDSDAGEYIVQPALDPVLDLEDPQTELDQAISEKYIVDYMNGSLVIGKLVLKITPQDVEMVYGDELPAEGFDFIYEIEDSTAVVVDTASILSSVETEHTSALTNEISLVRGVALVNGIPLLRGTALVNGGRMIRGVALVNGVEVSVQIDEDDTAVYVDGVAVTNGMTLPRGLALVNGLPFLNLTDIIRGAALVNGDEITFEDGFMTELNGEALENRVPATRGLALVNGEALVDGHHILAESGITTVDGMPVPDEGIVQINDISCIRGTALVNSGSILRGTALVNGLEVPIENGIPDVRGLALVNGIPLNRGTALVNNLEVEVFDGEVTQVSEDGSVVSGIALENGIGFIRGVALVNGNSLFRGTALVNGIALPDDSGYSEDVVNLEDMNLMSSQVALTNGSIPNIRGTALVNGLEGLDGQALKIAAGIIQSDGTIVYENVVVGSRGLALVNGFNYVRGTALVNGEPLLNGNPIVNGSSINENSNMGTIMVFDATDLSADPADLSFSPISFITGTTAGKHWIVPGTYISNNFEISYGLGELNILPKEVTVEAEAQSKTYGEPDPELSYQATELVGSDQWTGVLSREQGEDAGTYQINQGSLDAGENYNGTFVPAAFTVHPASLEVTATASDKVYDGTDEADVNLADNRLDGDTVEFSVTSATFADKLVGEDKLVTVEFELEGADAGNYSANGTTEATASITAKEMVLGLNAEDKVYDGTTTAETSAFISNGLVEGDEVTVSSTNGAFEDKNVGIDKTVMADVSASGDDAGNYSTNATAEAAASITFRELVIGLSAGDKVYDGTTAAATSAFILSGLVEGDAVEVSSAGGMFEDKNVGSGKMVTADVTATGVDVDNYSANFKAQATASITAKEMVIGLNAEDKVYDGATAATTSAFISSGLVEGDEVTVSSVNGAFEDKNVGNGKAVTADVSASGDDAGNYTTNATAEAAASITSRELVIGLSAGDKVYDRTTVASTTAYIQEGLAEGDAVEVSSTGGMFEDKNVGSSKMVTAAVSVTGIDASNYSANTTAQATASITPQELVIGLTAEDKVYDGNTAASTMAAVSGGLLDGDDITVGSINGAFEDKNVGSGKTVTAGVSISGADAGNYSADATAQTTASITQKPVNVYSTRWIYYIHETDSLPEGVFYYNGWISGDEGNEGYTALRYWDWIPYDNTSIHSVGIYKLTPTPTNGNYSYKIQNGTLVVLNLWPEGGDDGDSKKSAKVTPEKQEDGPESLKLTAYPNPVVDRVYLEMKNIEDYELVQLYDLGGRSHPVTPLVTGKNRLEIDMTRLSSGHYFIRVVMKDESKVVQIMKNKF